MKNIHAGHRKRMREKFLKGHAESLCDHELIEMLLFYCIPVANTNNIAHELINSFGSISGVFSADTSELMKVNGINQKTSEKIAFVGEFMRKFGKSDNEMFTENKSLKEYYSDYFRNVDSEVCLIVSTEQRYRIIDRICIPTNIFTEGEIPVNLIARKLLEKNMHHIVAGINHSKGNYFPTYTDYNIVQFFSENLSIFDITLKDCFICSGEVVYSIMENGFSPDKYF